MNWFNLRIEYFDHYLKQRPGRDHRLSTGQKTLEVTIASQIKEAAEVSQTKNWDATQQWVEQVKP